MKAGLSLNVFWQGISKTLLRVDSACMFKRLYCAFVWLSLFPRNSVSCYKIKCTLLVTLTERLHSWYCAKLDQSKLVWPCAKLDPPINSQNWISCAKLDLAFYLHNYGTHHLVGCHIAMYGIMKFSGLYRNLQTNSDRNSSIRWSKFTHLTFCIYYHSPAAGKSAMPQLYILYEYNFETFPTVEWKIPWIHTYWRWLVPLKLPEH